MTELLYKTGYTRTAIVRNAMLQQGTILLTQRLSTEELVLKINKMLNIATSAAPRRLDRGDVDLLHPHHRIKCALCFIAAGG
jgi:hypothetical protein